MMFFFHKRWVALFAFATLLPAIAAARGQSSPDSQQVPVAIEQEPQPAKAKPMPIKPEVPGMGKNHRLILKDGTYQMVRDYKIAGERVRYLSQERGEWEEMPADLVDWDATRKWENAHAAMADEEASPAMKEAASLDREEQDARNSQKARSPEVAPGLELPDQDGVFVLDTYRGTPELVELLPTDLSINTKSRKGIAVLNPLATQKANLELDGAHAKVHLHVNDPAIYLSLDVEDEQTPSLSQPLTVNTHGAKAVNDKRGAHSEQSGFAIVRLDERRAVRVVGAIHVSLTGKVTQDEDTIPAKTELLPGKRWLKIVPEQALTIGEYAVMEILSPSEIGLTVWEFRVDPRMGENPGAIDPIQKQADNR